jgi:acetyltransferase-like isoleucine patch superfamily enzyme
MWMGLSGPKKVGRIASFMAWLATPGHKDLVPLSEMSPHGFIHPFATINHSDFLRGHHTFIDTNVTVYKAFGGGPVRLDNRVRVMRGGILETGEGGRIRIGEDTWLHPNTHVISYIQPIEIGKKVLVAPNCVLYSHNHGMKPGITIYDQPNESKGPVILGDGCWLGAGVSVLTGVTVGEGAVVGAGSVVTRDLPPNGIAVGIPAKVVAYRGDTT